MRHKGMLRMACFHNQAGSNRLFAQIVVKNAMLYSVFQFSAKEINDSPIDAAIHQTERVGGAHHAIKFRQLLEFPADNFNIGQAVKPFSKSGTQGRLGIYQDEAHLVSNAAAAPKRLDTY